ncbi:MAG: hypothetical protein RIQ56_317, partial [Candidatus Parcubacteria bacterium]
MLSSDASTRTGLHRDYIGRLCRERKILGKRIGKNWYVEENSLDAYIRAQEVEKSIRNATLSNERVQEYAARRLLERDGEISAEKSFGNATSALFNAPSGVFHAATHTVHSPHIFSALSDFLHKFVALVIALSLTFGTYALINPEYGRYALKRVTDDLAAIPALFSHGVVTQSETSPIPVTSRDRQLAAVGSGFSDFWATAARAFSAKVDQVIYAIAFPEHLFVTVPNSNESPGSSLQNNLAVHVAPYVGNLQYSSTTPNDGTVASKSSGEQIFITQPIVERIREVQTIIAQGGISPEILDARIALLRTEISKEISSARYSNSTQEVRMFQAISSVGRSTSGVTDAGALTGTLSIAHGGTGLTATPAYGELLVGNGSGGYGLVSTSSLGIVGVAGNPGGSFSQIQFHNGGSFGGDSSLTFDSSSDLLSFKYASSTAFSSLDGIFVGRTSTTSIYGSATSTFGAGIQTSALFVSGSGTSSFSNGLNILGGCFSVNGSCITFGGGSGASFGQSWEINSSGYLTPTTSIRVLFGQASSTLFSANQASFGATGTSTFSSSGTLTLSQALGTSSGGTGTSTSPTYGRLLVGNSLGGYDLLATSSLGINAGVWGSITGTLSSQSDLQAALDAKLSLSNWYATTTNALAEGSNNLYFTNARVQTYLNTVDKGYFFSTTSASNFLSQNTGSAFSTTSAIYFVDASSTIPKTYTANTFSNANTFNGSLTIGSLDGPLQANAGVVSATTSVGVRYGGTGLTSTPTYGQLLVGNGSGYTLSATSTLGLPTFADLSNFASFAYPFIGNATSTTLTFSGGLLSTASTTIGNGTQAGGLTISGGATTTGNFAVEGTGTSTFSGGIRTTLINVTSSATSSAANGWNITGGCYAIGNTCLSFSTLAGQINLGTQVTGTLGVGNGGTGSTTLSGLLKGN